MYLTMVIIHCIKQFSFLNDNWYITTPDIIIKYVIS